MKICSYCFKVAENMKRCSNCFVARYCSKGELLVNARRSRSPSTSMSSYRLEATTSQAQRYLPTLGQRSQTLSSSPRRYSASEQARRQLRFVASHSRLSFAQCKLTTTERDGVLPFQIWACCNIENLSVIAASFAKRANMNLATFSTSIYVERKKLVSGWIWCIAASVHAPGPVSS